MEQNNKKIGSKVFVPAVCIGLFTLLAAFFTKISPRVGMSVGVFVAVIILRIYLKSNTPSVFLKDCRRMMDVVGPLSMLPMLLAALGPYLQLQATLQLELLFMRLAWRYLP